jgi:hypothetical protein
MSRNRRAELESRRSLCDFVDALRSVLGLDPLVHSADDGRPAYHSGWPEPADGCRRVPAREAS